MLAASFGEQLTTNWHDGKGIGARFRTYHQSLVFFQYFLKFHRQ